MFKKTNFEQLLSRSIWFFIVVSIYGISQKTLGYSPIEKRWIQSGLSFANEKEFLTDDIRPFSTFASMPEFTLFIAIFLYFYKTQGKRLLLLFAFCMLYTAGSRGVFVSTIVAYFFTFIVKKYNGKYLFLSSLTSLIIYFSLVFLFPLLFSVQYGPSRMLAYGTFNGRVEMLAGVIDNLTFSSIFTGIDIDKVGGAMTFDNMYFMLIVHFGIFGGIYFLYFLLKQKLNKKNFYFLSIFLGYGFYADEIFSLYLMFLFFFAIYSNSNEINDFFLKKKLTTSLVPIRPNQS